MTTWLYGLILPRNAPRVPQGLRGIGDTAVRLFHCDSVAAIVGTVAEPVGRDDVRAMRAHDRVLRSIAELSVTVASVRFGQAFETDAATCTALSSRKAHLVETLERLDGFVEMRLLLPEQQSPAAESTAEEIGPGRAYLESLRRSRPASGVSLRDAMGPLIRDERVERLEAAGKTGVVFAHLIDARAINRYREEVAGLTALAAAQIVGPLPLYSFGGAENG